MTNAMRAFIDANAEAMIADLRALVGTNSFSRNKAGSDRVQEIIKKAMPAGYALEIDRQEKVGDHYIYTYDAGGRPIALHGHIDTLCPEDAAFCSLDVRGDRAYGPGAHDMKAGIVTLIWSLKTLEHLGVLDKIPLIVIFNADEEIGSNTSKRHFLALAEKDARLAIKFECAAMENTLVTTRKGIVRYTLTARGEAAHFGNLKKRKISAIEEIGNKIRLVEALNREDKSVAANVGKIGGGIAGNIVAAKAFMEFEARFWDKAIMDETVATMRKIALTPTVEGVKLALEETSRVPPWKLTDASRQIFETAREIARGMGMEIVEEKRGGISDSNWVASAGVPAIDGFGPIGQGDCTRDEYVVLNSLWDRIEMTVRFLLRQTLEKP